jgi:hypothetical protein
MAKKKTAHAYELELKRMVEARTGVACEIWLMPQVRATAANMVMIDRIQDELLESDSLTDLRTGSMGQQKIEVTPLLPHYDKAQRTLMMQFEALGLNYSTPTSKLATDPNKEKEGKRSALVRMLTDANENMTEIPDEP